MTDFIELANKITDAQNKASVVKFDLKEKIYEALKNIPINVKLDLGPDAYLEAKIIYCKLTNSLFTEDKILQGIGWFTHHGQLFFSCVDNLFIDEDGFHFYPENDTFFNDELDNPYDNVSDNMFDMIVDRLPKAIENYIDEVNEQIRENQKRLARF